MKLIVGLGNPGPRYAKTRHNIGFRIIDALALRWSLAFTVEKFHAFFAEGAYSEQKVVLLKPTTFMNKSGDTVLSAGRFYKIELTDLLIISDDLALPLGKLRMRAGGSAGSHKGLQNIIDRLGTEAFCRLRVGIDSAWGVASEYVLGEFEDSEQPAVQAAVERAADAVQSWITRGVERTMNSFNAEPPPTADAADA